MSHSRTGLTIIETVIAMMVLVLGIFAVFDALVTSKKSNERATNNALALQEIQAQIETLQYLPFTSIKTSFRGIGFSVNGLKPPDYNRVGKNGRLNTLPTLAYDLPVGTVTRLANTNIYSVPPAYAGSAVNPNAFLSDVDTLPLRFRVEWQDSMGPTWVELVYVLAYRGI